MISTRLGVAVAWGLALVLAAAVAVVPSGGRTVGDRALVPGLDPERVTALAWGADVRIRKTGEAWWWERPAVPADADTVSSALAALRAARWHRRAGGPRAGPHASILRVTAGGATHELRVGTPTDDQAWIDRGDHAVLVDAWVARALTPPPLALRIRRPLAAIASARAYRVAGPGGHVAISGSPRRLGPLLLDPAVAGDLERALAALELIALADHDLAHGLSIEVDAPAPLALRLADAPTCAPNLAVSGTFGAGCVSPPQAADLHRALARLHAPPASIVERRPVPFTPATVRLPDDATLDVSRRPRIADRDADPERVAELLAVLALPAEPSPLPATPRLAHLTVTDRAGATLVLDLHAGDLVVRRGEPVALRVGAGAFALLTRASSALADATPWREEPTTITRLELDATTYTRGAVLGEWTRTGPGRDDPAAVEQLVTALAAPAAAPTESSPPPRHTLTLHVTPLAGPPRTHTLALAPDRGACRARVGDAVIDLAPTICALVTRLIARP